MVNPFIKPVFTEEGHRYDSSLGRYTSITTFIHSFEKPKDWDGIAQAYLNKRTKTEIIIDLSQKQNKTFEEILELFEVFGLKKNEQVTIPVIQAIWKNYSAEACAYGSEIHKEKELADLRKEYHLLKNGTQLPIGINPVPVTNYFKDLPDGIYPELLLWDNETMLSGTADKIIIETINGIRYVEIEDYKTNKEIKDYNYINSRTGEKVINEYMLSPFQKRCNCNYWHYQIQLNMYGYMLTKFGFKIRGGKIIHTRDNDKEYKLLNLQKEVHEAFETKRLSF